MPEAGEAPFVEEGEQRSVVVLVDGFWGPGGVVGAREGEVAGAPLLGEGGPVCGGEVGGAEADGGGEGGGGGGEGVRGVREEGVRYGFAPVDEGAEDVEEEGFGRVGEGHGGLGCDGLGSGGWGLGGGSLVGWLVGFCENDAAVRGQPCGRCGRYLGSLSRLRKGRMFGVGMFLRHGLDTCFYALPLWAEYRDLVGAMLASMPCRRHRLSRVS